jgi:hypothetical protein
MRQHLIEPLEARYAPAALTILGPEPIAEGNSGIKTVVFTVLLDEAATEMIAVDYATFDGTAVAGSDYNAKTGTVTFQPGETLRSIEVQVRGDTVDEEDETFLVRLSNASGATIAVDEASATILDDDAPPTISIRGDGGTQTASIFEGDSGDREIPFVVQLSQASGKEVRVRVASENGTATAGEDYEAFDQEIVFMPGETSREVNVRVFGDTDDEPDENFTVTLSDAQNASLNPNAALTTATGVIRNDEITVSVADVSIVEGDSGTQELVFTITLNQNPANPVTVNYATANGTAVSTGTAADFTAASGVLTFEPGGPLAQQVAITILGDEVGEPDEDFFLRLTSVTNAQPLQTQARGVIENDDPVLRIGDAQLAEDGGKMLFTVTLEQPRSFPVTVNFQTINGTALAGQDFTGASGQLSFASGELSKTIEIDILNDALDENDETFLVRLSNAAGAGIVDAEGTGTILDNDDAPTISIRGSDGTGSSRLAEGDSGVRDMFFTLSLSAPSGKAVTVRVSTADGTAIAGAAQDGADYEAFDQIITMPAGTTTQQVRVRIFGDANVETDEDFTIALSEAQNAGIDPERGSATGVILDDEVKITIDDVSIVEGNSGTAQVFFTVSLDGVPAGPVTVDFATVAGTATAGEDFVAASGTLTFIPGEPLTQQVAVTINGDTLAESDEEFFLRLTNSSNAVIERAEGKGTILNDDAGLRIGDALAFESSPGGTTTMAFTVTLENAPTGEVSVRYSTRNGTAIAGEDFAGIQGALLTFEPGETSKQIFVTILSNSTNDAPIETFTVELSEPSGAGIIDRDGTGTIVDNATPLMSISNPTLVEGNAGTAQMVFVVSLNRAASSNVTVSFQTVDGTAVSGGANPDYDARSGTLIFAPGVTQQTISVPVRGDVFFEANETFTIELSGLSNNAFLLSGTGTGTIVNDDAAPVVSIAGGSVVEGNSGTSNAVFTISLNAVSGVPVSVTFNTQDGAALAGSDYVAVVDQVVTFAPGETSKTVAVAIQGDEELEPDEIFRGVLSAPTGAVLGTSSADMVIRNDDIAVSIADATFVEGDSGATLRGVLVQLSAAPLAGAPVAVTFDFVNGTAVLGSDFEALNANRTLTFNPGETQKFIEFNILGDTLHEADETFTITLTGVTNAVATTGSAAITITNDDAVPRVSIEDATVIEGNLSSTSPGARTIDFAVRLSAASSVPISVKAFTLPGSAAAGDDFVPIFESSAQTITFAPGETEKIFRVTIHGDAIDEAAETFSVRLFDARVNGAAAPAGTIARASATGTITDDDQRTVNISDASVVEGASGNSIMTFTVSLSEDVNVPVSVDFATFSGTAVAGSDFVARTGTATFAPGAARTQTIEIEIIGDTIPEFDEFFFVRLSNPVNLVIGDGEGRGTIITDEVSYRLEVVGSATVAEGAAGTEQLVTFKVTRAGFSLAVPGSVNFATVDGTATSTGARRDFEATSGVLDFAANETEKTATVRVFGDAHFEADEDFLLRLSHPVNGALLDAENTPVSTLDQAITISNDDVRPTITINDVSVAEGSSANGKTNAVFTITLSAANELETTRVDIKSLLGEGTARAESADGFLQDYEPLALTTLDFVQGTVTRTVSVEVLHDTRDEADEETFVLELSNARAQVGTGEPTPIGFTDGKNRGTGTILDDDATPVLRFEQVPGGPANGDLRIVEGAPGADTTATLRLVLSNASERGVAVNVATLAETATLGVDFLEGPNFASLISFGPGETLKTIEYIIKGDAAHERDETFSAMLSGAVNATIGDSSATVTILNDDPLPGITINDRALAEGNSGITEFVFTVSLSGPSDQTITVQFTTIDGTAISTGPMPDFIAASGSVTFEPGQTSQTLTISVLGDTVREKVAVAGGSLEDERFTVRLSGAVNASIAKADGIGTILDDGDTGVALEVRDASVVEGNSGRRPANFIVQLSAPATEPLTFRARTLSGTAAAGSDFDALDQVFTIAPGASSITVAVQVLGDTLFEATESFFLAISETPEGVQVLRGEGRGVIFNDDIQVVDSRTIRFVDVDGDLVTVRITQGSLTFTGSNPVLTLRSEGAVGGRTLTMVDFTQNPSLYNGTSLSITTEPQPGFEESGRTSDGKVNVGYIRGALIDEFTLRFSQGMDFGTVRVDGDVAKIVAGNSDSSPAIRGSLQAGSLGMLGTANMPSPGGSVSSSEIDTLSSFLSTVNRIQISGDVGSTIRLLGGPFGKINRLEIDGGLRGDLPGTTGIVFFTGRIGSATIGEILGGSSDNSGSILGDFARNASVGSVRVLGSIEGGNGESSGRIAATRVGSVAVGVGLEGGSLVGGGGANSGSIFSSASLSSVTILGDLEGGAGNNSGQVSTNVGISKLQIAGSILGGSASNSGQVQAGGRIGSASILGDIEGGTGTNSGTIRATNSLGTGGIDKLTLGSLAIAGSGHIKGGAGGTSGLIEVNRLGSALVFGSVEGGAASTTGGIFASGAINRLDLRGNLEGGSPADGSSAALIRTGFISADRIGALTIGGDILSGTPGSGGIADSGAIRVAEDIGTLLVEGSILGQEASRVVISAGAAGAKSKAFGKVTIDGDARFFDLLGGYSGVGSVSNPLGSATQADAQIGTIQIRGQLQASNLVAGAVRGADQQFGTSDDAFPTGTGIVNNARILSTIARVIVGGIEALPGSDSIFGIVAERITQATVGIDAVALASGPGNDDIEIGGSGTKVRIRELR